MVPDSLFFCAFILLGLTCIWKIVRFLKTGESHDAAGVKAYRANDDGGYWGIVGGFWGDVGLFAFITAVSFGVAIWWLYNPLAK